MNVRSQLAAEVSRKEISYEISKDLQDVLDYITAVTHEITPVLCRFSWALFKYILSWLPNETLKMKAFINFEGASLGQPFFQISCRIRLNAFLDTISNRADNWRSGVSEICIVFGLFPLRSSEKPRTWAIYTSTSNTVSNFLCQRIYSTMLENVKTTQALNVASSAFASELKGAILPTEFHAENQRLLCSPDNLAKDCSLNKLAYSHNVARRTMDAAADFVNISEQHTFDAYNKIRKNLLGCLRYK